VRRFTRNRFVLFALLLSQLLAAAAMHVPVAQAAHAPSAATTMDDQHCPGHDTGARDDAGGSTRTGTCDPGLCVCSMPPAVADGITVGPGLPAHARIAELNSSASPPARPALLFRPPI